MQMLGFGLAVAVLLDATVIRMVLVPAFMQAMGRWNWWPGGRALRQGESPKDESRERPVSATDERP
jgi:RND superfamily putative drug exporter